MIIQATRYGTKKEEPFAFTYSGDFTDERVDGVGDVTLNTSGVFEVLSGTATVSVYILGAGGGCEAHWESTASSGNRVATGGGGAFQTVNVELYPATYPIVIGAGGAAHLCTGGYDATFARDGGYTTAFGYTSNGGNGGRINASNTASTGSSAGGSPNGNNGRFIHNGGTANASTNYAGGSPNGGGYTGTGHVPHSGGNGLVRITFS